MRWIHSWHIQICQIDEFWPTRYVKISYCDHSLIYVWTLENVDKYSVFAYSWLFSDAWFIFSSRQHEVRQWWGCKTYICLVCRILNLFLAHLVALENMSVNQSRVKGNENVSPRYWRCCDYILIQLLNIDCGLKFNEKCGEMKPS